MEVMERAAADRRHRDPWPNPSGVRRYAAIATVLRRGRSHRPVLLIAAAFFTLLELISSPDASSEVMPAE